MIFGFEPFGVGPFGAGAGVLDRSVPDPIVGLLSDPLPQRTYLFYSTPLDPAALEPVDVKIGDGFASDVGDTLPDGTAMAHALFRAGLVTPYNAQNRVMSNGELASDPQPTQGDIVVEMASGRLRSLLDLEWDNARSLVMVGRKEWQLSQFSPIFTGVTGPLTSSDTSELHLSIHDNSYALRRPIQSASYRGMGAALRGDGATTTGSVTLTCPAGAMSMELWVRPKTVASAYKYMCGWQSGNSPGARFLRLDGTGSNRLAFLVINDSSALYNLTHDSLAALVMVHVAAVLDPVGAQAQLYVNGDLVASVGISGTFNTVLSTFRTLRRPDAAVNFADADINEVRLWNYALSQGEIRDRMSRVIPADTTGLVGYWKHAEGTGTTAFDSTVTAAHLTLAGTVKWVGSLEGGSDIAGQPPPIWEGVNRQVQPVPVDSQNYVFEVSRNPSVGVTVTEVADKGALSYTMDASVSDIYDWTPVAGHCVTAYMDNRTLLRLQAAPQGTLTCTVTSDTTDTAGVVKKYAKSYGGWTDAQIDLAAFSAVSVSYPGAISSGIRLENRDIWDLMKEVAFKAGGWVTMTRAGLLTITILGEPGTPRFSLTENDIQASSVQRIATTPAVSQVKLNYRPYSTTQSSTELSTSLTESQKSDLGQSLRTTATPVSTSVLAIRPSALPLIEDTLYDSETVANAEALRRLVLWSVTRITYLLPLTRGLFEYDTGDSIEVSILGADGAYVENLNGVNLIVVGYVEDPRLDTVHLEAWGAEPPVPIVGDDAGDYLVTDDGYGMV